MKVIRLCKSRAEYSHSPPGLQASRYLTALVGNIKLVVGSKGSK